MFSNREPGIDVKEEIKASGTYEYQDLESATNRVLQRINAEPAYRIVLYKILEYCNSVRPSSDVEQAILSFPEMKAAMHSPQMLLSWLKDAGGIKQLATEEGDGLWCTTPAGRNAVTTESYDNRLRRLLAQEPIYKAIYLQLLQFCLSPKSRAEIESILSGNYILEKPKVYPSFFLENLEKAGGLEWDKKWKITSAGQNFLNGQAQSQT